MAGEDDDFNIGVSELALFNALVVCDESDGKWKIDLSGEVTGVRGTFASARALINAISETSRLVTTQQKKAFLRTKLPAGGANPPFDVDTYDGIVLPSHDAPEMSGTGTARKASMVAADGVVEADFIKTYDIVHPSELLFLITSFASGQSLTQLIGTGSWLAAIMYSATYQQPIDVASINSSAVSLITGTDLAGAFPISMIGPGYTSSALTVVDLQYPASVGDTIVFRLTADHPAGTPTQDETITFLNNRYRGLRTRPLPASGAWTAGDIAGLTSLTTEVSADLDWTYSAGGGPEQFDVAVFRDALGSPSLKVNEFNQEPQDGGIVSLTNANGFTEDYRVWILENCNAVGATIQWS
jgi:hypothetical protein